ncbi:MAG: hypothetical protein HEQ38_17425 [Gemmatimonas sp.]|uniref:hypothetical protein n=1 Tax=Gemmatimonas sp. TaxID=1962908 RepID=UPI0031C93322|nr:hypothetical protein [Gemmatimonas sp.]
MFREGVNAGLIGALTIALWFLILDVIRGDLLGTPVMLGNSLISIFLQPGELPSRAGAFLLYTVFHVAAFAGVGLLFAWGMNAAERTPSAFIGFAGLFIVFEIGWLGWTAVLAEGRFGELSWLQVFLANLIAAGVMGYYLFRQHPGLAGRVELAIAGSPE